MHTNDDTQRGHPGSEKDGQSGMDSSVFSLASHQLLYSDMHMRLFVFQT